MSLDAMWAAFASAGQKEPEVGGHAVALRACASRRSFLFVDGLN